VCFGQANTGHRKVLRLHWESAIDGSRGHLDLTPEHGVRLLDGSYVAAECLQPDDRILCLSRKTHSRYSRLYFYGCSKGILDHVFVHRTLRPEPLVPEKLFIIGI
jgi:hypothetical protein